MNDYIKCFNQLALTQQASGIRPNTSFWIRFLEPKIQKNIWFNKIDSKISINLKELGEKILDFLYNKRIEPRNLPGYCFDYVPELSMYLSKKGLNTTITIGNVLVNGKPHYSTTSDSIQRDILDGYLDEISADAHCWLTFENGLVVDLTILSSIAQKNNDNISRFEDAIYASEVHSNIDIVHVPYHLGYEYLLKVVYKPSLLLLFTMFFILKLRYRDFENQN